MKNEEEPPAIPATPPGGDVDEGTDGENIGSARMREDGVIEMRLIAQTSDGTHGEALIRVDPSEERYASIVAHLDAIQPGESREVRPFPPEDD